MAKIEITDKEITKIVSFILETFKDSVESPATAPKQPLDINSLLAGMGVDAGINITKQVNNEKLDINIVIKRA